MIWNSAAAAWFEKKGVKITIQYWNKDATHVFFVFLYLPISAFLYFLKIVQPLV